MEQGCLLTLLLPTQLQTELMYSHLGAAWARAELELVLLLGLNLVNRYRVGLMAPAWGRTVVSPGGPLLGLYRPDK
jgi:hypothetical protein